MERFERFIKPAITCVAVAILVYIGDTANAVLMLKTAISGLG